MSFEYETERREFVRLKVDIPVRYKFLSRDLELDDTEVYEGTTSNISGSGLRLIAKMPDAELIPGLLMERIVLGVNILLPGASEAIKALTRVAWVEATPEDSGHCAIGLKFKEITKESQDTIFNYVIKSQMKK